MKCYTSSRCWITPRKWKAAKRASSVKKMQKRRTPPHYLFNLLSSIALASLCHILSHLFLAYLSIQFFSPYRFSVLAPYPFSFFYSSLRFVLFYLSYHNCSSLVALFVRATLFLLRHRVFLCSLFVASLTAFGPVWGHVPDWQLVIIAMHDLSGIYAVAGI